MNIYNLNGICSKLHDADAVEWAKGEQRHVIRMRGGT